MDKVSVIVPCKNEEKFITKVLNSLIDQDYPKENLEILVVDGMSSDGSQNVIKEYEKKYAYIKLLENSKSITPAAMNLGIKQARGNIIIKMDAHSVYEKNYISKCIDYLTKYDADNVGGILVTRPGNESIMAKAIARSLSHFFGVGSSPFRKQSTKPRFVDTVAFGCYKKSVFETIGYYDERLVKSSDMELNTRLTRAGGKILLVPEIVAYYYADATIASFLRHNFIDGFWTTYPLAFVPNFLHPRHLLPLFFVAVIVFSLILGVFSSLFLTIAFSVLSIYFFASFVTSFHIAGEKKDGRYFFLMPLAFATRHFGYGIGSLWGLIILFYGKTRANKR